MLPTRTLDVVLLGNMHRYVLRQQVSVALLQRHLQEFSIAMRSTSDFRGKIYDRTKGTEFKGQPFPEFMQKLIAAGGLVKYTNSKRK